MSGKWTPSPDPIISKRLRCDGVAWANRHDQDNGTLIVRPSASRAVMASLETSRAMMRGSLLAAVFIPDLPNISPDAVQLLCRKAIVVGQGNRFEPELA